MNKKIMLSGISILVAVSLMAGSAYALFSSQATSSNNTFTTGSADLLIAPHTDEGAGTFSANLPGPVFNDLKPGDTKVFYFWLKNNSTAGITLDIVADLNSLSALDDDSSKFDNQLLISWTCDTDKNLDLNNDTPTGEYSPRDWFNGGNATLGSIDQGENMFCKITGSLPSTANNEVSGETVIFNVLYEGTQQSL